MFQVTFEECLPTFTVQFVIFEKCSQVSHPKKQKIEDCHATVEHKHPFFLLSLSFRFPTLSVDFFPRLNLFYSPFLNSVFPQAGTGARQFLPRQPKEALESRNDTPIVPTVRQ